MLVDFCAFRSFGLRPHGVIEVVLGQEEFSFPTVLPIAVNVVSLGDRPGSMVTYWGWPWLHAMKAFSCRCKCGVDRP